MQRPAEVEYAPFYRGYVEQVTAADVLGVLEAQIQAVGRLGDLPEDQASFAYAAGKWSVRQLVGHMADAERVFGFRAFCFAHADANPLPGFDENAYMERSRYAERPVRELADGFQLLRRANLLMFRALSPAQWGTAGTANGSEITVRALAFVMAGHVSHHLAILQDRYGVPHPDA